MSNSPSEAAQPSRRVVINDASCLIDLHKGCILREMLTLPHDFRVALPVRENEILSVIPDWPQLEAAGLVVVDLAPDAVAEVFDLRSRHAGLSAEDCFSLVLARNLRGSLLLTGDRQLRLVAQSFQVQVHGALWVVDELIARAPHTKSALANCLSVWRDDPTVWLPAKDIDARLAIIAGI